MIIGKDSYDAVVEALGKAEKRIRDLERELEVAKLRALSAEKIAGIGRSVYPGIISWEEVLPRLQKLLRKAAG